MRFDIREALVRADSAFCLPVPFEHIRRPERRGDFVRRFVLPLELAPTTNRTRHAHPWKNAGIKSKLFSLMLKQAWPGQASPLPGRPQVLCCRFSSVEPDAYADGAKMAIDLLCVPQGRRKIGLGFLRDDRPKDAEIVQWWEPAKRGEGFLYIEVRAENWVSK